MMSIRVSLDAVEYERVRQQAQELGISIADVIRRAVRDVPFAGFVESGSRSVDDVIYGAKDNCYIDVNG